MRALLYPCIRCWIDRLHDKVSSSADDIYLRAALHTTWGIRREMQSG